ncbi:cytochrome c [Lignipirellula cremea]|nr:cytochrome c [Lignipirellula cremea]
MVESRYNFATRLNARRLLLALAVATFVGGMAGCGPTEARFRLNTVYMHAQERKINADLDEQREQEVANVLSGLFGTPDAPNLPELAGNPFAGIVELGKLQMAAGPVGRDPETQRPRGLYREHCAHCHGVTGNGLGPTASFLNPYPRDFRRGTFKFKSTKEGDRPSREDLHKTLYDGIAGTAMPSFKLLKRDELDALADYVRYLSIRGQTERALWEEIGALDEDQRLLDPSLADSTDPAKQAEYAKQLSTIRKMVTGIAEGWQIAGEQVVEIPPRATGELTGPALEESIARGRELFNGTTAACSTCHGVLAVGDGRADLYDKWTEELEPANPDAVAEYEALGALPPRVIKPRNLRSGVYRGGRRPIDLYWRIHNGIEGSGMPAASMKPPGAAADAKGLSEEDLWSIIDYVRSLPYESMSQPPQQEENKRARAS